MKVRGRAISPPASLWPSWHRMPFQLLGHQDVPDCRPSVEFNEEARLYCLSGQFGVAICLFAISRRPVHSLLHHSPPPESVRKLGAGVGRMRERIEACTGLITGAQGASEPTLIIPAPRNSDLTRRSRGASSGRSRRSRFQFNATAKREARPGRSTRRSAHPASWQASFRLC